MQAGVLGLLRAIDAYKPEAAASFRVVRHPPNSRLDPDAVRSLDTVGRAGREAARAIQGAIPRPAEFELGRSAERIGDRRPARSTGGLAIGSGSRRHRWWTISLDEHGSRDATTTRHAGRHAPDPKRVDPAEEAPT